MHRQTFLLSYKDTRRHLCPDRKTQLLKFLVQFVLEGPQSHVPAHESLEFRTLQLSVESPERSCYDMIRREKLLPTILQLCFADPILVVQYVRLWSGREHYVELVDVWENTTEVEMVCEWQDRCVREGSQRSQIYTLVGLGVLSGCASTNAMLDGVDE